MDKEFARAFITISLAISFIFGVFIFLGISANAEYNAIEYYAKELKAEDAIIKSPAIIKVVHSYSEFQSISGKVYIYNEVFYKIPDSYIGYMWQPKINITGLNGFSGIWELKNP